jgi:tryptophan-rich sensory protein
MNAKELFRLVISISLCVLIGSLGGYFTAGEIDTWYAGLNKPNLNPPNWIFAPVWTVLYVLMGIALYYFWTTHSEESKKNGYMFFFGQLVLNFLWTFFFFSWHRPLFAFIDIILLIGALIVTIYYFSRVKSTAGLLLVPYLLWVLFATYLNLSIIQLN